MSNVVSEWMERAESDFRVAQRESTVTTEPSYDAVCFHAQQCAEKYLKAHLQEHGVQFPRTHSLIELLELALTIDQGFELQRPNLILLDRYAVRYRYPGDSADRDEARQVWAALRQFRASARQRLGL